MFRSELGGSSSRCMCSQKSSIDRGHWTSGFVFSIKEHYRWAMREFPDCSFFSLSFGRTREWSSDSYRWFLSFGARSKINYLQDGNDSNRVTPRSGHEDVCGSDGVIYPSRYHFFLIAICRYFSLSFQFGEASVHVSSTSLPFDLWIWRKT